MDGFSGDPRAHGGQRQTYGLFRSTIVPLEQYAEGKVTPEREARDSGVLLWETMGYARAREAPARYDLEDLRRDLETIPAASGSGSQG